MSISTKDYAFLSAQIYGDMENQALDAKKTIGGEKYGVSEYKILEVFDNKLTGYQGAIYQNKDTREIVVAHRGTEMKLSSEIVKDIVADGAMVLEMVNTQRPDAMRLMDRAKQLAELPENRLTNGRPDPNGQPAPISTTGHSLGGFLAQYTASQKGVPGETFNAYGAAGLYGVPEGRGAHPVINHVRATDFVSAANGHFGEVRVYASVEDINALAKSGASSQRQGSVGFLYDVVANVNAHKMGDSFWPPDKSVVSEENRQRYRDNTPFVDAFREDI